MTSRDDCEEGMIDLLQVLNIITMGHVLEWFDQVSQVRTHLSLTGLRVQFDEGLLDHVIIDAASARLVLALSASCPHILARLAHHLFVREPFAAWNIPLM